MSAPVFGDPRIHDYIEFSKKQKVRVYVGRDNNGENKYLERDKLRSPKSTNEYLKCLRKAYRDFKKAPRNKSIKHLIPNPPEFDLLNECKRVPTPVPYNVTKTYLESFDDIFCTDTLGSSGNIRAVQQLAGHQDISTTQKHLHAADEQLRRAVDKLANARPLEIGDRKLVEISPKTRNGITLAASR